MLRLFGSSIHSILVHFPSALLPLHLLFGGWGSWTADQNLLTTAHYMLICGVVGGWLAIISGTIDLAIALKTKKPHLLQKIVVHGGINGTVLFMFSLLLFREMKTFPELVSNPALLTIEGLLILGLITGNYFGGKLVTRWHIGIEKEEK